jgi:cytochrome c
LRSLIDDEHKEPPDPGPLSKPEDPISAVKSQSDEAEELLQTAEVVDEQLLPFTGLNLRSNRQGMELCDVPISRAGLEKRNSQSSTKLCIIPPRVSGRCLWVCLMASEGNKSASEESGRSMRPTERDAGFRKRAGKEIAGSSSGAKNIIVINMSGARQAMRARFLAVGLFLSVLLANSQQVIEHMKRVWKIRGQMEASPLEAGEGQRKFILEFTEEGDRDHVVRGGPWQYKGDAFLVEGLQVGADPATALFTHVPMWVQFRNIPFYLLTKKLARDLGEQVGTLIKIDDNARGNICDKILRVRIQLPLYLALQKVITLMDEITDEEVDVQIRYERLPNFCLFCGYIGHMEARCDTPVAERKICFSQELRVRPVHFEDPRTWFLPEAMGQPQAQTSSSNLWRAPNPTPWPAPWVGDMPAAGVPRTNKALLGVEEVVEDVAKLCVNETVLTHDNNNGVIAVTADANSNTNMIVQRETEAPTIDTPTPVPMVTTDRDNTEVEAATFDMNDGVAAPVPNAHALDTNNGPEQIKNNAGGEREEEVVATNGKAGEETHGAESSDMNSTNIKKEKGWKRYARKEKVRKAGAEPGHHEEILKQGASRVRARTVQDNIEEEKRRTNLGEKTKKGRLQPPSLSECLGKEGLMQLRKEEQLREEMQKAEEGESKEATGPGAAGPLSGADVSAWQEP